MSTPIYYDSDADLSIALNKRLAFIGYGNQGAAQAKNLRDSGVREIVIGNRDDAYKDQESLVAKPSLRELVSQYHSSSVILQGA